MELRSTNKQDPLLRAALLQDGKGKVQVILPNDCLLDLVALSNQMGREFSALSPEESDHLSTQQNIKRMPGFDTLYDLPTIVDMSIYKLTNCSFNTEPSRLNALEEMPPIVTIGREELVQVLNSSDKDISPAQCAVLPNTLSKVVSNLTEDPDQIFNSVKNFSTLRIKQRLEETLEIPPLPQTAQRIIQLRVCPDANITELAEIVEADASLAAQVVSWAASPYYAAPGKISSVQDAIVRVLGFDLVSNLALGLALGKTLALPQDGPRGFTPYWLQSVYCSTLIESIVRLMPMDIRPSSGLAYLSGLLHNFGYLVLAHVFPPHFSLICRHIEANPNLSHVLIENYLLQVTREQMSSWLMQLWNMPEEVCCALRFQHAANYDGELSAYPNLIYLALRLLRQEGIGDAPVEEIPLSLYQRLQLDSEDVADALDRIVAADEEVRSLAKNFA